MIRNSLIAVSLLFSLSAFAVDPVLQGDRQGVDSACTADAATAGCGGEVVGKGLMKCLHAYKKTHPGTTISAPCLAAMRQLHADKKAGK